MLEPCLLQPCYPYTTTTTTTTTTTNNTNNTNNKSIIIIILIVHVAGLRRPFRGRARAARPSMQGATYTCVYIYIYIYRYRQI